MAVKTALGAATVRDTTETGAAAKPSSA